MSEIDGIVAFSDIEIFATLYASNGDRVPLDVSSFNMSFEEGGIPTAMIKLVIGSSLQPSGAVKLALAHVYASEFEKRNRVTVSIRAKGHQTPGKTWVAAKVPPPTVIFDGYLSGPGYHMQTSAASLTLQLDHWLVNLACTSKFSYLIHPSSNAGFDRSVSTRFPGQGTGADASKPVGIHGEYALNNEDAPKKLGEAIVEVFTAYASVDTISEQERIDSQIPASDKFKTNQIAISALQRFFTGKKAKLSMTGVSAGSLARQVSQGMSSMICAPSSGNTFWETLKTLSDKFYFSIIPTVNTVNLVPALKFTKNIDTAKFTILAQTYHQLGISAEIAQLPIAKVRLFGVSQNSADAARAQTDKSKIPVVGLIGMADLSVANADKPEFAQGATLTVAAPVWLTGMDFCRYCGESVPAATAIKDAANPSAPSKEPTLPPPEEERQITASSKMGNRLATAILTDAVFGARRGTITGMLRFDIAPGTPVRIEVIGKNIPFAGGNNKQRFLYAYVYKVDCVICGESKQAYTTLHMSNIRTEKEQTSIKGLATGGHPVYDELWSGTDLLDGVPQA